MNERLKKPFQNNKNLSKTTKNQTSLSLQKLNRPVRLPEKYPPLIPISMIGIERTEDIEQKEFCTKTFFKSNLF